MDPVSKVAFDTATEITVAFLDGVKVNASKENGESIADLFEAIYNRVLKLAKDAEVK